MKRKSRNLQIEKKYRLWTFQSIVAIEKLKNNGILKPTWDEYFGNSEFIKSYRWMAKQMAIRNIGCYTTAPVWAWHSCGSYEKGPKLVDARCLLSDIEIEAGIQTIEFECPAELALLSWYGNWNRMLDEIFTLDVEVEIDKKTENGLFKPYRRKFWRFDSIQATLPYLKLDWVIDIRDLNLKPNDWTYNTEEDV